MDASIYETFELPSKGLVYDKPINPKVTLRSMNTLEEMQRLSPTDTPYKVMSDIIEACMKDKPEIHVCDMILADYQFLLHKLRIVSYGPKYKMLIKCDKCKEVSESIADLETLELKEYTDEVIAKKIITLPKTGKQVELRFQTPHDLDIISYRAKEMKKKTKQNIDYSLLFTIMSLINKIDGKQLSYTELEEFVKTLPNRDANYILNKSAELAGMIGLNTTIPITCINCGNQMEVPFRITSEFFGPTTD